MIYFYFKLILLEKFNKFYTINTENNNLSAPGPVKIFESGRTKVLIYKNSSDAAIASVLNVVKKQIKLVKEKIETSIMVMAAPSGYDFYKEYINIAKHYKELQSAWALIEYKEKGYLSSESLIRLDRIWDKTGDLSVVNNNKKYIRNALDSLEISYQNC